MASILKNRDLSGAHGKDLLPGALRMSQRSACLPPYGREVAEAIRMGHSPNVRLYACRPDPWRPAQKHRATFGHATILVLPLDKDAEAIQWPPVLNLVANVTGLPGGEMQKLARALVRDGVRLIYMLDVSHPERNLRVVAKRHVP